MARIGYSSIMDGARSAGTSTPRRGLERTAMSATASPDRWRAARTLRSAPISARVVNRPARSGFTRTERRVTSEPGETRAATRGKGGGAEVGGGARGERGGHDGE